METGFFYAKKEIKKGLLKAIKQKPLLVIAEAFVNKIECLIYNNYFTSFNNWSIVFAITTPGNFIGAAT